MEPRGNQGGRPCFVGETGFLKVSHAASSADRRLAQRFDRNLASHARDSVAAADHWIEKIDRTLKVLASHSRIGEAVDHLRPGTRRFNVGNYQLFFEPLEDGIRLLRVYHASRRIEELFED